MDSLIHVPIVFCLILLLNLFALYLHGREKVKLAIDLPKHTAGALGVGGRAALFRPHRLGHVDTGLWFMRRVLGVLEDVPPQRGLAVHEKSEE